VTFTQALADSDLWEGEMLAVSVNNVNVLLIRVGEQVRAYEDRCAHLRVRLSQGTFGEDGIITCAVHRWQFDARTGRGVNPQNFCLHAFPVRLAHGFIWIDTHPEDSHDRNV
jgi:toluene monooxygenase system ferredoxin subunit